MFLVNPYYFEMFLFDKYDNCYFICFGEYFQLNFASNKIYYIFDFLMSGIIHKNNLSSLISLTTSTAERLTSRKCHRRYIVHFTTIEYLEQSFHSKIIAWSLSFFSQSFDKISFQVCMQFNLLRYFHSRFIPAGSCLRESRVSDGSNLNTIFTGLETPAAGSLRPQIDLS